jgi:small-conductance mechanosensitive channel
MNSITFSWIWGIGLIIGLPLVTILLGEWIHRLKRRKLAFASTVRLLRDVLLPMLALLFFLQHLLLLDPASRVYKTVETIFWVCVIHASLSLLNVMLFEQAGADTWRSRVPKLLIDLARLFLILLGSAFVLSTVWKADLAGLVTALGISSIVIGLALQDTLGSIMS